MKIFKELIKTLSEKKFSRWIIGGFLISVFLIENSFFGKGYFTGLTGQHMIDMNFHNSITMIKEFLNVIQIQGRNVYMALLGYDFFLILTFFLLQSTMITKLLRNLKRLDLLSPCLLIALTRVFMDVLENVFMLVNTKIFPQTNQIFLTLSGIFTTGKWIATYMLLAAVIGVLVLNMIKMKNHKRSLNLGEK